LVHDAPALVKCPLQCRFPPGDGRRGIVEREHYTSLICSIECIEVVRGGHLPWPQADCVHASADRETGGTVLVVAGAASSPLDEQPASTAQKIAKHAAQHNRRSKFS
jgi:hypothetical protein